MGRIVRRVPADWVHPVYTSENARSQSQIGKPIPLFANFTAALAEWEEGAAKWAEGFEPSYKMLTDPEGGIVWEKEYVPRDVKEAGPIWSEVDAEDDTWENWEGERPNPARYMPSWPDEELTHLMMYENTSEGTPLSPPFETAEELARWLFENNASAFAYETFTYAEWLEVIGPSEAPVITLK